MTREETERNLMAWARRVHDTGERLREERRAEKAKIAGRVRCGWCADDGCPACAPDHDKHPPCGWCEGAGQHDVIDARGRERVVTCDFCDIDGCARCEECGTKIEPGDGVSGPGGRCGTVGEAEWDVVQVEAWTCRGCADEEGGG